MVFERGARFLARFKEVGEGRRHLNFTGGIGLPAMPRLYPRKSDKAAMPHQILISRLSERTAERPRKTDADRRGGKRRSILSRTGRPQSLIAQFDSDVLNGFANAPHLEAVQAGDCRRRDRRRQTVGLRLEQLNLVWFRRRRLRLRLSCILRGNCLRYYQSPEETGLIICVLALFRIDQFHGKVRVNEQLVIGELSSGLP